LGGSGLHGNDVRTPRTVVPALPQAGGRPNANVDWLDNPHANSQLSDLSTARSGWITFAGVMALNVGDYNALSGIGALSDDDTLAGQATNVLYGMDLTALGLVLADRRTGAARHRSTDSRPPGAAGWLGCLRARAWIDGFSSASPASAPL
jgi:hypothetical protein